MSCLAKWITLSGGKKANFASLAFFRLSRDPVSASVDIGEGKMTSLNIQSKILVCECHGLG